MNPVDDSDLLLSELADYVCPISGELMHAPVIADDGHSYERASTASSGIILKRSKSRYFPALGRLK